MTTTKLKSSKTISIFLLFLLVLVKGEALILNEVMPYPLADDSLNEWVEIYNNYTFSINATELIIGDNSDNDTLIGAYYQGQGTNIEPGQYAIITDDKTRVYHNFNISPYAIKLYVNDSSIGNGLNNNNDTIYLYHNNSLVSSFSYNDSTRDKSLALHDGIWADSNVTPGYNNNGSILVPLTGCDWIINILLNESLFAKDDFEWRMQATKNHGNKTNITGTATIVDLYGNTIKEYSPWTNQSITTQKTSATYTPNLQAGKSYVLTSLIDVDCNDTNTLNNKAQKHFSIIDENLGNDSSIVVHELYDLGSDGIAKFGQTARMKISVYKGDTTKNAITTWIQGKGHKISKQSKTNIYTKFTQAEQTIPIQLKPNCDFEYEDGKYSIMVKGLDQEVETFIDVQDITSSLCDKTTIYKSPTSSRTNYEILETPLEIQPTSFLTVPLQIDNTDDIDHTFTVYSYIYRGSKSYSGERDFNAKKFTVKKNTTRTINLNNKIENLDEGSYKIMVRVRKDDQKTESKLTRNVQVKKSAEPIVHEVANTQIIATPQVSQAEERKPVRSYVVYESSEEKAKQLSIWIFLASLGLYSIVITWKGF